MKKLNQMIIIFCLILSGCSDEIAKVQETAVITYSPIPIQQNETITPVTVEQIQKIKISDYFPKNLGTTRNYVTFGGDGKPFIVNKQIIMHYGSSNSLDKHAPLNFAVVDHTDFGGTNLESIVVYEVTENIVKQIHQENSVININQDRVVTELTNQPEWIKDEETKAYITSINEVVNTKAGVFHNCLEVTEEVTTKSSKEYSESYYAPNIGLIMTKVKSEQNVYEVYNQITDFSIPNEIIPSPNKLIPSIKNQAYINQKFAFVLILPSLWDQHYEVKESKSQENNIISFLFKTEKQTYSDHIMSIFVSKKSWAQIEEEDKEAPFRRINITTRNGLSYTYYYNAGEPSTQILQDKNDLQMLLKLIDTVPKIIETFAFK